MVDSRGAPAVAIVKFIFNGKHGVSSKMWEQWWCASGARAAKILRS